MGSMQSRRQLLTALLLGASGLLRTPPSLAAEGPPETATLLLGQQPPGICIAPQYVADALLQAEGFTDIQYVISASGAPIAAAVADGKVDFSFELCCAEHDRDRSRRAYHDPRWRARRLFRTVRA